jgi:hypothetical protein
MNDRQNTIVCVFDPQNPHITAYQIHEWTYERLQLPEEVRMIQMDGPRRCVYIKFAISEQAYAVLRKTSGQIEYRHDNGELSTVQAELAGKGTKRIRIANLPPEVPDRTIRDTPSIHDDLKDIREETWSRAYRHPVSNGIRIAVTYLKNTLRRIWQ